jgi:epoxyqueuosine reductase
MTDLTAEIKDRALAEAFDLVGIATAGLAQTAPPMTNWLKADMQGTMAYMKKTAEIRCDPSRLLPECRSIVAIAMSYRTSQPSSQDSPAPRTAWVSRYAWGRDYHKVLKKKLIRVGKWLSDRSEGCFWRACVDTAPLLERDWARQAGLGWIGKNTALINRRYGSELFLGFLLTNVVLHPDATTSEHCGRCTACLDACPTQAFVHSRCLDARRCIAYLTIEHDGPISGSRASDIGNMIAGCDICQEVCPWNRRAPADLHPEFEPKPDRFRPRLDFLSRLDEDEYLKWRSGSALNRIGYSRFQRNLEIVRVNLETCDSPMC